MPRPGIRGPLACFHAACFSLLVTPSTLKWYHKGTFGSTDNRHLMLFWDSFQGYTPEATVSALPMRLITSVHALPTPCSLLTVDGDTDWSTLHEAYLWALHAPRDTDDMDGATSVFEALFGQKKRRIQLWTAAGTYTMTCPQTGQTYVSLIRPPKKRQQQSNEADSCFLRRHTPLRDSLTQLQLIHSLIKRCRHICSPNDAQCSSHCRWAHVTLAALTNNVAGRGFLCVTILRSLGHLAARAFCHSVHENAPDCIVCGDKITEYERTIMQPLTRQHNVGHYILRTRDTTAQCAGTDTNPLHEIVKRTLKHLCELGASTCTDDLCTHSHASALDYRLSL
ncbi:MAG: hypothetical protein MHM6MM_000918 [Cercozoa sp. M6MM]